MKIAFICDTPYQVLNGINYCYHLDRVKEHTVDLYLGNQFYGSYDLMERIINEGIFQNVYGFEEKLSQYKMIHYFHRMQDILFPKRYLKNVLKKQVDFSKKEYDIIYLSVPTMFGIAFSSLFQEAEMMYYDDGLGSYYDNLIDRMNQSPQGKLCRLFGISLKHMEAKALYVNNPYFCKSGMTKDIRPLPSLSQCSEEFRQLLYRVFAYTPNPNYENYRMIYLSQPNDSGNKEQEVQSVKIMEALEHYEKDCMVRPHPRQKELHTKRLMIDRSRDMWELLCINQITEKHILLGTYSTAQIVPKLFFNKEPYLIFMYKIEQPKNSLLNYEAMEQMIENLKAGYEHPEKIKIPKDIEELKRDIEGILHE